MRKYLFIIFILAVIPFCFFILFYNSPSNSVSMTSDGQILFQGKIDFNQVREVKKLYEKYNPEVKITKLILNSPGGDMLMGRNLGKWIYQNKLDVEVLDICASACANYLFVAGKQKILNKHSLIIFHGGTAQLSLAEQLHKALSQNNEKSKNITKGKEAFVNPSISGESLYFSNFGCFAFTARTKDNLSYRNFVIDRCINYNKQKDIDFYQRISVDRYISHYGQINEYQKIYESYEHTGFYYSIDDLLKMGISNIKFKDASWEPQKSRYIKDVYQVKLPDTYEQPLINKASSAFLYEKPDEFEGAHGYLSEEILFQCNSCHDDID